MNESLGGQFAIVLGLTELPELLRRVAATVEKIPGFRLLNLVVHETDGDLMASVYYYSDFTSSLKEKLSEKGA